MVKKNYPTGNYVWQQDGAPSHMAAKNQKFCKDNMAHFWPKNFWPPSSPDLNPLDFSGGAQLRARPTGPLTSILTL
ncbi:Uncharacterized protein FKW44_014953 [Caligus rogercresseyi]|uniref:Uncharacterized protein n=1 Tax=Caligus rogercresseyi TaxID=217165 RepID=A0A7T8H0B4_CALRO|nr:Uncharacterized protein FKW44_014953 [Caligus rogercresseyi]